MKVLASPSAPWAATSSPFQRKPIPAALPTLTTSSRVAWNDVAAGAIRVSCVTSCPSAVTEIHEFLLARTISARLAAGFSVCLADAAPKERIVTSPFLSTLTASGSVVVSGAWTGAEERIAAGGVAAGVCADSGDGCGDGVATAAGGAWDGKAGVVWGSCAAGVVVEGCGAGELLDVAAAGRLLRERPAR